MYERERRSRRYYNARRLLAVAEEFGSFDAYAWRSVGGRPVRNAFKRGQELPARVETSDVMSRELRRRGFKFVGSVVCYAFMQAVGMVNDHTVDCFRYGEILALPSGGGL